MTPVAAPGQIRYGHNAGSLVTVPIQPTWQAEFVMFLVIVKELDEFDLVLGAVHHVAAYRKTNVIGALHCIRVGSREQDLLTQGQIAQVAAPELRRRHWRRCAANGGAI
jgi:hypothetical protein